MHIASNGGMDFTLSSPAFADGAGIPVRHTCDGQDLSPRLTWSGTPRGTRSLALIMDDPDAPRGTFTHWLVYDIPRDAARFPEGLPHGQAGRMLANDFGRANYGGPCPPPGHGPHRYRFTLYALDMPVIRVRGGERAGFDAAVRSHILDSITLTGIYERK